MCKGFYNIIVVITETKSRYSKSILILFFAIVFCIPSFSQSNLIEQIDYNKDSRSLVFMLNSNGFTTGFRFSKRIDGFRSRLIDLDLSWVRHPKERRMSSAYGENGKFVYGKLNQLLVARTAYGRQKELYGKYSNSGIAINFYYLVGANLGLLKPVYFEVIKGQDPVIKKYITEKEKFDKEVIFNSGQIFEGASFFDGFDEIKPAFGGFIKLGFSFDINKKYRSINTLELGAVFDLFHKKLPLMAYSDHQQYLLTLFIAYRFGQKMDKRINNQ